IQQIEKNKFLGVVLDVFEEEPLDKKNKLWDFSNVIIM
ncbi:MAG: dihydrofolate reductase, partial [Oscillospiraceae bacterium]|nr:dihydrofolate reductase [Oscillospiraceae bacterium]